MLKMGPIPKMMGAAAAATVRVRGEGGVSSSQNKFASMDGIAVHISILLTDWAPPQNLNNLSLSIWLVGGFTSHK